MRRIAFCKLAKVLTRDKRDAGIRRVRQHYSFEWSRRTTFPHPEAWKLLKEMAHVPPDALRFHHNTQRHDPCWIWCEELKEVDWSQFALPYDETLWRIDLLQLWSTYRLKYGIIVEDKA